MSYDIQIGEEEFNYTCNVSPMWYAAKPDDGIRCFYGLSGGEAFAKLREIRDYMEDNYESLIKMGPKNGWGDYFGALRFVNELIAATLRNPDEIWKGD